jgi:hypothetical protein
MDEKCGRNGRFTKKQAGFPSLVVANGKPSPILDNIFWLLNS